MIFSKRLLLILPYFAVLFLIPMTAFCSPASPPLIPLSNVNDVEDLYYTSEGTGYFVCQSDQGLTQCEVWGKEWKFHLSWPELEKGKSDLIAWLGQNQVSLVADAKGVINAYKKIGPDKELYCSFALAADGYTAEIVEKITLLPEKSITIDVTKEFPTQVFYTVHDGKTMDRLDIDGSTFSPENPDEHLELFLGAVTRVIQGKLNRYISFSASRNSREGTYWEIQDMPQFPGTYRWYFTLGDGDTPPDFKLSLVKGSKIPELKNGDALGGLLVKNVPYGAATAIPEYDDENTFPGFSGRSQTGDVTPSGEALFWLPPGMWSIHVNPGFEDDAAILLKSHFIPVQPGKMTFVEWPKSLNDVFVKGQNGKMKILSATAAEKNARLDIAMLGTDRTSVVPSLANFEVAEAGQKGKVVSIERINTPADIVLLLDSSGSMRGQMQAALNATTQFIKGLPKDSRIRVVDFDTQPTRLRGETAKDVLRSLKGIQANGATALYDSILLGVEMLSKSDRPSLVVFTDGVDANHDDTGPGSNATQEEVLAAVSQSGIPVFTIGFGAKSDVNTLSRIADMSGGEYYVALDQEKLGQVFAQINSNLGSQFRVEYERPKSAGASNRPVMSIMVDNSGSMDSWPDECSGCDKRMEKTRQVLRKFIEELPDDFLIQVSTFSGDVVVEQVLTDQKQAALRGIAQMEGRSTTNILASLKLSLKTLQSVPSNKRYLVYLADAALDVDDDEKAVFDATLGKIKDANISTLFIGMVGEEEKGAFEHAAQKTNGKFVVSKDFDTLSQTFEALSKKILGTDRESTKSIVRVAMTHRKKDGENQIFSAAKEVQFPLKAKSDQIAVTEEIVWKEGESLRPYDSQLSTLVSGTDVIMKDVRVLKRLPLNITAKNKATAIHLNEALSLSRFRGIEAPDHLRFFAVTLEFENILPKQKVAIYPDGANHPAAWVAGGDKPLRYEQQVPTYLIPDIRNHIFLRWNNNRSFPVSEVTWLAQEPLTLPGQEALAIDANNKVKGTLMFMVPSDHMQQSSLHLYDTNYGHIDIPISGILKTGKSDIEALPKKNPAKLSDAFSFRVTGIEQRQKIETSETGDDTTYVIVDGDFTSKMQAHLNLDPRQRFKLKVPSAIGNLFIPLHPATSLLPLGFFRPTLVTPGTQNPVRMVFNVPQPLVGNLNRASILIDIHGGGVEVPLYEQANQSPAVLKPDGKGKGVSVKILSSGMLDPDADIRIGDHLFVVEVAIQDEKDNHHTQVGELIVLKNKNFDPDKAAQTEKDIEKLRIEAARLPSRGLANFGKSTLKVIPGMLQAVSSEYYVIGGLDEESIVPDGETVNGVFFFDLPADTTINDWEISSLVIPNMAVSPGLKPYQNKALFAKKRDLEIEVGTQFLEEIEDKLFEIMTQREAEGFEKQGKLISKSVEPGADKDRGQRVPPLSVTASGKKEFRSIKTMAELKKRLETIRFLPSGAYTAWVRQYQPEAVLNQNWGTENDLAFMAEKVLTRQGFATVRTQVDLTANGRKALADLAGVDECSLKVLPAIRFIDDKGKNSTLVAPFMKEVEELKNLVINNPGFIVEDEHNEKIDIRISLLMEPTGSGPQQNLVDIVDVLGGGDGKLYSMTMFNDSFEIPLLSTDAIDIGYTKIPVNGALSYQAVVDTPSGRIRTEPEYSVSTKDFKIVGEIITLTTAANTYTRRRMLKPNEKITGIFHTLGINLPDLTWDNARAFSLSAKKKQDNLIGKPDAVSALKWYTRGILARFISAQTTYENELAKNLNLIIGRTKNYRCIMVTVAKAEDDTPLTTHMDLIYPHNMVHKSPDEMASRAFNIMSGMASSQYEAAALGKNGTGLLDIWQKAPKDTALLCVDEDNRDEFVAMLEQKDYSENMVEYFKSLSYDKLVMFPASPSLVNGQPRWAWLEFNKQTYQVVSVLDTGENGSMVENVIGNPAEQAGQYMVGVLVGIDVSLWSVAAFSLEMDDYKQILKAAKKFAEGMGNNFGVGAKIGKAAIGVDVGGAPSAGYGRIIKKELSPSGFNTTNNALGFGNGYNDGVAYYFKNAQ